MIDLHRLAGFQLVANAGGYHKAARLASYPITAAALHQQVRKLEAQIGVQLLQRLGKDQMQATAAGRHLLAHTDPFLRELPAVVQRLRRGDFANPLAIQAESLLIRQLLPQWLLQLRRRRPQIELHLQEVAMPDANLVRSGEVDLLVAHLPQPPEDLSHFVIAELHPCLVLPRGQTRTRRMPPLRELAALPFIAYASGSRQHQLQLQALTLHGVTPQQSLHVDTADAILGFVESGLGWSLVPALEPQGPTGRRLRAFALSRPRMNFPVYALWRASNQQNAALAALLACAPRSQTTP